MNKPETFRPDDHQLERLDAKTASFAVPSVPPAPPSDETAAHQAPRSDRAEILFRSGHCLWDEIADSCVSCSPGMATLTGHHAPDLWMTTRPDTDAYLDALHPEDRADYRHCLERMRVDGAAFDIQYRLATSEGGYVDVQEIREPVLDESGRVFRSHIFLRDISELRCARDRLKQTEERFRHYAIGSTHFLWEMDQDLRFSYVSDGIRTVTGENPAHFIGKTRRDIAGELPIDPQALQNNLDIMDRREAFTEFLIERPRTTGGKVHLSISGKPLFDDEGRFLGYRGTAHDVTDVRRTLDALDQSEAKYRDLIEGSIQGIFVTVNAKPVFANQACADIFGFSSADAFVALDSLAPLLTPEDCAHLEAFLNGELSREDIPTRYVSQSVRADGSPIWLETINRPVEWEGQPAIQTTVVNITKRKQTEIALRQSEARLRAIMDHAPVEIFLKDAEGRYVEVNRHFQKLWGVCDNDARGKLPADIHHGHDYPKRARQHDLAVLRQQKMIQQENLVHHDTGETRCLHATKFPILDASGTVTGLGAIAVDTTDRWRAEKDLKQARDDLETKVKERTAELERLNRALQESQAYLSDAIESISDGFVLFDAEERLVLCNTRYREMFSEIADRLEIGIPLEELLRVVAERGLVPDTAGSPDDWVARRLSEYRSNLNLSDEQQLTDGRWILANLRRTAEGGIVGIRTDITERKNAEMALAKSEDRLRQAAELAGIGYCIWDSVADRCVYCSDEYARIHGTTVEGYLAKAAPAGGDCPFTHPDDRQAYRIATEALRREGKGFRLEYRMLWPGGETRHVRAIVKPVFDDKGAVIQEYLTIQDISAQKENEIALRNNQDLLMAIIDHAPAQIDVKDESGRFMLINRQMEDLFGARREEVIGKTSEDFFGPEIAETCTCGDDDVLASGDVLSQESIRALEDGEHTYLSVKFKIPQIAGGGNAIGRITTDITELKQREKALRDHQEILDTILNAAPVSITVKDPDSRYVYVNRHELRAFGVTEQHYIGQKPEDLVSARIASQIMASDRMVLETGQPLEQYEEQLRASDNSLQHWLTSKVPVVVDGKVRYIVTTSLDVTEAKAREQELRQAQKMEALGKLTGGIAHDFNNLLAVVTGNLMFLRRKAALGPKFIQYLDAIETAANMGTALTGELLAFARPSELSAVPVNVPDVIDSTIKSLFRALPASIETRTDFPPDIWTVQSDPQQLQNALFNIALNAKDAMPDGGMLTVKVRNRKAIPVGLGLSGGSWVEIVISDTGIGMEPDKLEQVFEPFFTTKPAGAGTGLGLSMVHRFVELSGGHIRLASAPGAGTSVKIYLPRAGKTVSKRIGIHEPETTVLGGDETILVVEDDTQVRKIAVQALRDLGYHVLQTATGEHALKRLKSDKSIALLFSDIELGGELDGYDLAHETRSERPDVKILFCSGHSPAPAGKSRRTDDKAPLLRKPYQIDELGRLVRHVLEQK